MLREEVLSLLSEASSRGWLMEPQAKEVFRLAGLDVTRFLWTEKIQEAARFASEIGYPVVAKVVSPEVIHKSDVSGVVLGISNDKQLGEAFKAMSTIRGFQGVIVEETVRGTELILGMKLDKQFGPIIMLGTGGTAVEIYKDVAIRMAPLREQDIESMLTSLKARPLLEGYRGAEPISVEALKTMLLAFSSLVMEFENKVESIDLNPVICNASRCVITDARIMLAGR
ncbi:MAG: hypothetical protein A4E64_02432 [Syntrophorhabdus sp. PtaU1.Bin058]|nr:MAG: hypothetical protein A4E64_02432 [Syntrophorhabdus sp. PtaU1.Bin058]